MSSPDTNHLPALVSSLDRLTEEELIHLNRVIVERIRLMREVHAHGQMANLQLGRRVKFTSATGHLIRGVLTRHNRKSVTIIADDGHQWRVSPGFVEPE